MSTPRASILLALASLVACENPSGGGGGTDGSSAVRIMISTQGVLQDPDGYDLSLAGTTLHARSAWDTVLTFDDADPRTLTLEGVNPNCAVAAPNPQTVELVPGGSVTARVVVRCQAVPVRITVNTSGTDPDPDGYTVRLGNGPTVPITPNGEATLLAEFFGDFPVTVSGLAANCRADGSVRVTVVADRPLAAAVAVTCRSIASLFGSVRVKIESNLGGAVLVNGGWRRYPAPAQGELVIADLPTGTYRLGFDANSWGCSINGLGYGAQIDGVSVEVVAGTTTDVTMVTACLVGGP